METESNSVLSDREKVTLHAAVRKKSDSEWIDDHASGTLRKARRVGFAWRALYLVSVDWYESNELLHLVNGHDGRLMFIRNARFQVGGDKYNPPAWKKSRATWVI